MSAHAGFILAAYALTAAIVLGMVGKIVFDHRQLRRELTKFPPRGEADES